MSLSQVCRIDDRISLLHLSLHILLIGSTFSLYSRSFSLPKLLGRLSSRISDPLLDLLSFSLIFLCIRIPEISQFLSFALRINPSICNFHQGWFDLYSFYIFPRVIFLSEYIHLESPFLVVVSSLFLSLFRYVQARVLGSTIDPWYCGAFYYNGFPSHPQKHFVFFQYFQLFTGYIIVIYNTHSSP